MLSHAPALAEQLGRRPDLLDTLVDASAFAPVPPVEELAADFARPDRADEDYQMVLDRVRRRVNERRFALGVQLVAAHRDPIEVTEGYSRVAEAAIQVLADAAVADFAVRHGRVPGSELLILGLGRLGGEALTHASDLDLVYLFSGTHAESDGPMPLRATDYSPARPARTAADRRDAAGRLRRRYAASPLGRTVCSPSRESSSATKRAGLDLGHRPAARPAALRLAAPRGAADSSHRLRRPRDPDS